MYVMSVPAWLLLWCAFIVRLAAPTEIQPEYVLR